MDATVIEIIFFKVATTLVPFRALAEKDGLLSWVLSESAAERRKTFKFSLYRAAKTLREIFKTGLVGGKG